MSGLADYNYPAFNEAAKLLRGRGISINNPAEHFDGDQTLPREVYLRSAFVAVMASAWVALLPGWQDSPGALAELSLAKALNLPVYEYNPTTGWLTTLDETVEVVVRARISEPAVRC